MKWWDEILELPKGVETVFSGLGGVGPFVKDGVSDEWVAWRVRVRETVLCREGGVSVHGGRGWCPSLGGTGRVSSLGVVKEGSGRHRRPYVYLTRDVLPSGLERRSGS